MGTTTRCMSKLYSQLLKKYRKDFDNEDRSKTRSEFWGYPLQAHHLISCHVMQQYAGGELNNLVLKTEYDINEASNGLDLPAMFGHQMVNEEMRHVGNHDEDLYYAKVKSQLKTVYDKYKNKTPNDICKSETLKKNLKNDLHGREKHIRKMIENKKWWLYKWSKALYKGNYCDEGIQLNSSRDPVYSYKAGVQWLNDFGGPGVIKRRYWMSDGKPVLRKAWYEGHDYPVPKSLKK